MSELEILTSAAKLAAKSTGIPKPVFPVAAGPGPQAKGT
jgi:hypothetical protein